MWQIYGRKDIVLTRGGLCRDRSRSNSEGREVSNGHSSSRVRVKDQTLITSDRSMIRKGS